MPVLDKLTTVVEWQIDTSELDKYEATVTRSEGATNELSAAVKGVDADIGAIDSGSIDALSSDIEIATGDFEELAGGAMGAAGAVDGIDAAPVSGLGGAAESAAADVDKLGTEAAGTKGEIDSVGSSAEKGGASFLKLAGGAVAAVSALGAVVIAQGNATTVALNQARAVGLSADAYVAWDSALGEIGMSGQNVVNLMQDSIKRLGELRGKGEMPEVQASLKMLNLQYSDLKDLAPEKQFMSIMEAAKALDDAQVAGSAADKLLGGDAVKIIGNLRNYDGTVQDILDSYGRFNLLTSEGIQGSREIEGFFTSLSTAAKTGLQEIAGQVGTSLVPVIEGVNEWIAANRELIGQKIKDYADTLATAFRWLAWAGEKVVDLVESLGGAGKIIKGVAIAFGAWKLQTWVASLSTFVVKMNSAALASTAMKTAISGLKQIGMAGLFTAAYLAVEDLYYFLTGGNSAIGRFMDEHIPAAEAALLDFFGVTTEGMTDWERRIATAEFQQSFLEKIEWMKLGADEIWKGMKEKVAWFGLGFTDLGQKISEVFGLVATGAASLGTSISNFFGGIIKSIVSTFYGAADEIRKVIKSLPIVGDMLIGDGSAAGLLGAHGQMRPGGIPKFGGDFSPFPSGGLSTVAAGAGGGGQSVSNSYSFDAPITIHAPSGSDSEAIARAVSGALKKTFSDVKTTGIKR